LTIIHEMTMQAITSELPRDLILATETVTDLNKVLGWATVNRKLL